MSEAATNYRYVRDGLSSFSITWKGSAVAQYRHKHQGNRTADVEEKPIPGSTEPDPNKGRILPGGQNVYMYISGPTTVKLDPK